MHNNIGCLNNPKETGMPSNKLSNTDKAEEGSDATLLETKTHEVTQILNNTHTSVPIAPSKELTGTEAKDSQAQQPHRQTPEEIESSHCKGRKVTPVLKIPTEFQKMTNPEDVIMVDAPEVDDVQVGGQTPSQIAQNLRGDPQRTPSVSDTQETSRGRPQTSR